jgi:hypothetical protein
MGVMNEPLLPSNRGTYAIADSLNTQFVQVVFASIIEIYSGTERH